MGWLVKPAVRLLERLGLRLLGWTEEYDDLVPRGVTADDVTPGKPQAGGERGLAVGKSVLKFKC
jgi:hypothetical protein